MPPPTPDKLPALPLGDREDTSELAAVEEGDTTGRASHLSSAGPTLTIAEPEADENLLSKIAVFHQRRQKEKSRMFRHVMMLAAVLIVVGALGFACSNGSRTVAAAWAAMVVNAAYRAATGVYLNAGEAPIAACAVLYCCARICPTWWPPMSTWLVAWFAYDFLAGGLRRLPPIDDQSSETTLPSVIVGIGCLYILLSALIVVAWLWARRAPERCSPTMLFYGLCVLWAAVTGLQDALHGLAWMALPAEGSPDFFSATVLVLRGAAMLLPPLIIVLLGRQRLFNSLARLFDGNAARLRSDGAFVAELLDTVPIRVGQAWWVHRADPEERFHDFDPRRNWRRGAVVEASSSEFVVQLQASEAGHVVHVRTLRAADHQVRVQLASSAGRTREEILQQAQADLRCVEFEKLSAELMTTQDSRNKPELQAEWYALSRPVVPGERIDYFMSHSWHDDPAAKWAMIQKVAERFRARVGRYPTFWLDKVCIDQTAVSDGLKVLPVNVMACAKLLLLCGDTYPTRLWCVWELFTLYAFTSEAMAHERLECVFLGSSKQGRAIHNQMKKFRVRNAHCYDPNEESRLRHVINAVGTESFNQRICKMAELLKVDQDWSGSGKLLALARYASGKRPSAGQDKVVSP